MAPHSPATAATKPSRWPFALAVGVLGSLAVAFVVIAFLWPTKASHPHNLPVSIAGPQPSVSGLQDALGKASPDTFDFVAAASRDEAVAQIETRQTYGAILLAAPPQMPEVLTAPAGSAVAAQMLTGVATQLQAQLVEQVAAAGGDASAVQVTVTPIVPLAPSDPTGAGLAAAAFPMMMGGMIGGLLISLRVVGARRRLLALAGFAVMTGVVLALILQTWFQFLQGNFWSNAAALGLSVLATSAFIVGCASVLGRAGIGLGVLVTMFIANPLGAAAIPWQFLPEPWGQVGQYMVPGASNWLIRSLSYFPATDLTTQWLVLAAWALLGVGLTLIGHKRSPATNATDGRNPEDATPAISTR